MAGLTKEQRELKKQAALLAEENEASKVGIDETSEDLAQDPSFEDAPKDAATEHQKKIQKNISKKRFQPKPFKQFFTLKDGKILSVKVKENGAYSTYIASKAKMEKQAKGSYALQVKAWKKDGLWVAEEDYNEKIYELKNELKKG